MEHAKYNKMQNSTDLLDSPPVLFVYRLQNHSRAYETALANDLNYFWDEGSDENKSCLNLKIKFSDWPII